jgi:Chain length determinant protein
MLGHRAMKVEDYLTILKRRWWIVAIPVVLFPILAVGLTYVIPAQYVSQTTVLIDQQKVPDDVVKSVVTESIDTRLAFMEAQILSRSSIQPIVEKYNLYGNQHLSMDGRIDLVRKDIHVVPVESAIAGANGSPGFKIIFYASDPHTAQQVCSEVTSLFTGNNLKSREAVAAGTTEFLKDQLGNAKRSLDDQDGSEYPANQ